MKEINVGATSIDKKESAARAAKFIDEVSNGLHQGDTLSRSEYQALKKMARELFEGSRITKDDYDYILEKLRWMRKVPKH